MGEKVAPGESSAEAAVEGSGLAVTPGADIGRRVHPRTGRLMICLAYTLVGPEEAAAWRRAV